MKIDSSMALGGIQSGSNLFVSSGSVVQPTISFDPILMKVTVGEGKYRTFPYSTDFSGIMREFIIPQTEFIVAQNTKYYVCVEYNNGSPIMYLQTDQSLTNDSDILVIYTIFTEVDDIDVLNWDTEAIGLSNKLNERFIDTQRFGRAFGLELSSSNSILTSAGGEVYIGSHKLFFEECVSNVDECELLIKNGTGGYDVTDVTVFPNTKYDSGGSGLVDLTDTQYGVCWVWRAMGSPKELYITMGRASYVSLDSAKQSKVPTDLIERVSLGAVLIGRTIFQKGSSSATVESSFDTVFNASAPTQHNSLLGLQGGTPNEYYHMTSAERINHNKLISVMTNMSKISVYENTEHTYNINVANVYQKIIPSLVIENKTPDFTVDTVNGRLIYTGAITKRFTFNGSASLLLAGQNNMTIFFSLYRDGVKLVNTESSFKLDSNTSIGSINGSTGFTLAQNQYIELWASSNRVNNFSMAHLQMLFVEDLGFSFNAV